MNNDQKDGFTETLIEVPYPVTLFPNSSNYRPTPGTAIAVERCNRWGGERLIVKYNTNPVRKSSGLPETWPRGVVYVWERDVEGWKK